MAGVWWKRQWRKHFRLIRTNLSITRDRKPLVFLSIWNVFYRPDQQQQIMRTALERIFVKFSALPPDQIVRKAKGVIDFSIPTFKNDGFSRENEWRMIFLPSPASTVKPRYRARQDMLIPYFSLKDLVLSLKTLSKEEWRLPIRQACIGPSRHRELNRQCAQHS